MPIDDRGWALVMARSSRWERWARLAIGWIVVVWGLALVVAPVDTGYRGDCGWPAGWIAVGGDAPATSGDSERSAWCQGEARAQTVGGTAMAAGGAAVLVLWSRLGQLQGRWQERVARRARERQTWRPAVWRRLAWLALAGVWAWHLPGALARGEFVGGVVGVLRIAPVLFLELPAPWLVLRARPEGLEVRNTFRRMVVPWQDIVGVKATEFGIEISRSTAEAARWSGAEGPLWRARRRYGYAKRVAAAVEEEVAQRRGVTVEDLGNGAILTDVSDPPKRTEMRAALLIGAGAFASLLAYAVWMALG